MTKYQIVQYMCDWDLRMRRGRKTFKKITAEESLNDIKNVNPQKQEIQKLIQSSNKNITKFITTLLKISNKNY